MSRNPNDSISPREFIIRKLKAQQGTPEQVIGADGYGVEILDGGNGGYRNRLLIGKGQFGTEQAFTDELSMPCIPGKRIACRFDSLKFVPADANTSDQIVLKIITAPRTVWVDTEPNGKARTRFFVRTATPNAPAPSLAAGAAITLFDMSGAFFFPTQDHYWLTEEFEGHLYWHGFVCGDQPFNLWAFSKTDNNDASANFRVVQRFQSRDYSTGAAGAIPPAALLSGTTLKGFAVDFAAANVATVGVPSNSSGAGGVVPFPSGVVKLGLENIGAGTGSFEFAIGVRSLR